MQYLWVCLVAYAGFTAAAVVAIPLDLILRDIVERGEAVPFLCKNIEYSKKTHVDPLNEIPKTNEHFPLLNPEGCLLYKLQPADREELTRIKRHYKVRRPVRYVPDSVHDGAAEDISNAQHTVFRLGANPSNDLILNTFLTANHLEHARGLLVVRTRDRNIATIAPIESQPDSKFRGAVNVKYNSQSDPVTNKPHSEVAASDLQSAKGDLGVFRNDIRGGITKERLISRFIEVNKFPTQLGQHLTVQTIGTRKVKFVVSEGMRASEVVLNRTKFFGSKICTYKLHDDAKNK